ncbi:Hypothetical predicted protein [Paramuricea clavata]|uniref:Uncharacterized protein n=1 Tax=Paramuricea clavata TaxID=317549 RepID=A0A6S7J1G2_PARCT|nr:Hypothetical predicted protein [Paramuricea clavata]
MNLQLSNFIGCFPVSTAIGDIASGKSTALHVISKMMGMHMVSQSSGEFVASDLSKRTIPLSWDDPTHPSLLRQPFVSAFNGLGSQTKLRGNEIPLTSFLLTINFKMDDDMRLFAFEIVKLVDDSSIVSTMEVDNYLNTDFLPFIRSMYAESAKALTSFEEFFNLLLQAIIKCGYKKDKLSKWIKPVVHGRKEKIDYLMLIIQNTTSTIENAGFQRISDKNIRDLAKGMQHANVNHKASFAVFGLVDKDDTEDVDDDDERVSLDQTHECLRCADLQEEIRITDEKVEAKAKETEDVHEQQILEIKRRHEEELESF